MTDVFSIGKSGLFAAQKALQTAGHNIANVNTEGYSRQRVDQSTNNPIQKGGLIHGSGVRVDGTKRIHDELVQTRVNIAETNFELYNKRSEHLAQVEDIFTELNGEGLNKLINGFFNSFRELAQQPENETMRSVVRDQANMVSKDFRRISDTIASHELMIDKNMEQIIKVTNTNMALISNLNLKIRQLESVGDETGDLRDQRDLLVNNLSKMFKVKTYRDDDGQYNVAIDGVGTLVSGTEHQELTTKRVGRDKSTNNVEGAVEITFKDRPGQVLTNRFIGGKLGALVSVRNVDLKKVRDDINSICYDFSNLVNAVHSRGYTQRKLKVDENGVPAPFDDKGKTTGINFFKTPTSRYDAAANIDLSDEVRFDLSNIVTGLLPNKAGDNRVAIALSKIQHEKILDAGKTTLEEQYLKTIGHLGVEAGKAFSNMEQTEGLLSQAKSVKERISGVSLDEETANMVKYQHAYQASAKVIQTADTMFNALLSMKRT